MKFFALTAALVLTATAFVCHADENIDTCIRNWGKSPFKAGALPDQTIATAVKVLGMGQDTLSDTKATTKPQLVLIKPSINVLGKSKMVLANPNGWYCFDSNVSVLGKIEIEANCKAHLTSGKSGANVLGASDTNQGVTVLGSLRVTRVGCADTPAAPSAPVEPVTK
jgi:hypothetical protein